MNAIERAADALLKFETNGLCDYGKVCDLCDCFAHADDGYWRDAFLVAKVKLVAEALGGEE